MKVLVKWKTKLQKKMEQQNTVVKVSEEEELSSNEEL